VRKLAGDLQDNGLEIYFDNETLNTGRESYSPVDWKLTRSDFVIFVLSKSAVDSQRLENDVKKVMRQNSAAIIPLVIDDEGLQYPPAILKFMRPSDFRSHYDLSLQNLKNVLRSNGGTHRKTKIWVNPTKWVIEHFRRYLILHPLTFCWTITIENLVVSLAITGLVILIFQPQTRTNLEPLTAGRFIWLVIILGPILETLIFQTIPVFFARLIKLKLLGQILISVIPFAILHFSRSIGAGIGAGIIGGFYSAFTYVHWRQKSLWTAFWVTALSHGLYNLAIFSMIIGEY
jgi:hypothetical protein